MKSKLEQLKIRVKTIEENKDNVDRLRQLQQFITKERDNLVEEAITELIESINKENIEIIIISIGSGNAPKQQSPAFLRHFGKATVLNIDGAFRDEKSTKNDNANIEYIPSIISSESTPKAYEQLKKAISYWTHAGKKVIFMNHTFPGGHNYFNDIIRQNLDMLGSTFSYIGSYHQNQPVAVYSETFLDTNKGSTKEKVDLKRRVWATGKTFTDNELQQLLQPQDYAYGNFYCDLNQIVPNNLFPKNNEEVKRTIQEAVKKIKEFKYDDFDLQKKNNKQQVLDYQKLVKKEFHAFMNSKEMISTYFLGNKEDQEELKQAFQKKINEIDTACKKQISNISYTNSVSVLIDMHINQNQKPSFDTDEEFARMLQEEELINAGLIKKQGF
ncbi:hypothetical protein [Legionella cincinnatiensis]|uniref:Uncharacterized protein n=1 Tax=Legionella cincinnatiensis TaxID=28085 RepID=A0A378IPE6_9GAMM|nr:hypothetical protein [Legionella cincinnatiensis]KTC83272.1 hypothetical protein Lcin_2644 [Legionella cincinnatiensis]STX36682.1 Uncharacterised protein [Legionella cincinnatiensis]